MIRVVLPQHLRTLAGVDGEVRLEAQELPTQRTVLDALEASYPVLRGTIRDHGAVERRAFVRFFACGQDITLDPVDDPLPQEVASGAEPFRVIGAMAGGRRRTSTERALSATFGKTSTHVRLADFAIFGEVRDRDDRAQVNGIGGALSASTISNLWIQHTKVGMWLDGPFGGLTIKGCRIQDTTADGINLHEGVSHTVVENTLVRNTGDDGLAIWSDASRGEPPAHDNTFRFNTVELPILANGIAFYGGADNSATGNLVQDTVTEGGGIHVGNRFSSTPVAGTTTLARNKLVRSGSLNPNTRTPIGALWLYAKDAPLTGAVEVSDTVLLDSTYAALHVYGSAVSNLRLRGVRIDRAGTFGLQVQANGRATVSDVKATRLGAAGVYACRGANAFRIVGRATGLRTRYCGPFPAPRRR